MIIPVNHAPVANAQSISTAGSAPATGTLTAADLDGDALTYRIVSNGALGTAVVTNASTGAFTYTPSGSATGMDTFTFVANDGALDSAAATVTVTITASAPAITSAALASGNARQNFTFTLTASGTAPIQFAATGLPQGLSLNGAVITGMSSAAGTFSVQITATNAAGADSQTLSLVLANPGGTGNSPPQIVSGPSASQPSAAPGDSIMFTLAASDPNSDQLTITWDFGDGTTATGSSVSHAFTAAGAYAVVATVSDGAASVSALLLFAVNASGLPPGPFTVDKASVNFSFVNVGAAKDSVALSGSLPVLKGVATAGLNVTVSLGGTNFQFVLDKTGKGGNANQQFKIGKLSSGAFASVTGAYTFTVKNEALFAALKQFGFANANIPAPGKTIVLPVAITLGNNAFTSGVALKYTAKAGKSGTAK